MPKKKAPKKNAAAKKGASRHNKKDDERRYRDFENEIRALGLMIRSTEGDGNCLFRAISDQMFNNEDAHKRIRKDVCGYIEKNRTEYENFLEEDISFDDYVEEMRHTGTYGGNLELAAFAKMAGCDIKVYQPGLIYVIPGRSNDYKGKRLIYHLAYYDWEHYASIGAQAGNNSIMKDQPLPDRYKHFHVMEEEYNEDEYPSSSALGSSDIEDPVEAHQDDTPEPELTENSARRKEGRKTKKNKTTASSEEKSTKSKKVYRKPKANAVDEANVQEPEVYDANRDAEPSSIEPIDLGVTPDENCAQEHENEVASKQSEISIKKTDQAEKSKDLKSTERKKHPRKKTGLTRQEEKKLKKLAKLKRQEELEPSSDNNYQDDRLPDGMKMLYI